MQYNEIYVSTMDAEEQDMFVTFSAFLESILRSPLDEIRSEQIDPQRRHADIDHIGLSEDKYYRTAVVNMESSGKRDPTDFREGTSGKNRVVATIAENPVCGSGIALQSKSITKESASIVEHRSTRSRARKAIFRNQMVDKLDVTGEISDEALLQLFPKAVRAPATHTEKNVSNFCHLCAGSVYGRKKRFMSCANFRKGTCRKITCETCFERFKLGKITVSSEPGNISDWVCTHCRKQCPDSAQCRQYEKANAKLRVKLLKQKAFRFSKNASNTTEPAKKK